MEMICILPHNFEGKLVLILKSPQRRRIICSGVLAALTANGCCVVNSSCFEISVMVLRLHFRLLLRTQEPVVTDG